MDQDLLNAVRAFVARQVSVPLDTVHEITTLFGDLGVDGDDAWKLLSEFAREFQIAVDWSEYHRFFGTEGLTPLTPFYWLRDLFRRPPEEKAGFEPVTVANLVKAAVERRWPHRARG